MVIHYAGISSSSILACNFLVTLPWPALSSVAKLCLGSTLIFSVLLERSFLLPQSGDPLLAVLLQGSFSSLMVAMRAFDSCSRLYVQRLSARLKHYRDTISVRDMFAWRVLNIQVMLG